MRKLTLASLGVLLAACGPQAHSTGIKTPDEILAEQEQLGAEQIKQSHDGGSGSDGETDIEKAQKWDPEGATLEMKRAALSAQTCPDSVTEKAPRTEGSVTVVFKNDGHVKSATIAAPFDETAVGRCALRAFEAVIVKAFDGAEETLEWKVDLTGKKAKDAKGKDAKGKKAKAEEEDEE